MSKQLIPFPLPKHLAEFVISQMNTPVENLNNGTQAKVLHIKRRNGFGKLIHRSLNKSNKPTFAKTGFDMYIAVSNHAGNNDKKIIPGKYSFLDLDEVEIKDIIEIFDTWFKVCLVQFLDGAVFAHKFNGKTKGIIHASINEFMEYYKITYSSTLFATLVKHYQREKKSKRQQLQRLT